MSQYILISRLKVQNANAIAGFTWGFPAITHFLGFTHNLERKLSETCEYSYVSLSGCAVIVHEHHTHGYGEYDVQFTQSRNPAYFKEDVLKIEQEKGVSVIEEGKMNMTVSLLIGCHSVIGNRKDDFINWLRKACLTQRLAGGSILNNELNIEIFSDSTENLRLIKRKLLPGFVLMDRANYLQEHYEYLCQTNPETELLDAWLDFAALKKTARPKSDLISKHLLALSKNNPVDICITALQNEWQQHLAQQPYHRDSIPEILKPHFANLELTKAHKELLEQWQNYLSPNENTDADWESLSKPKPGYLVPIMTGYKAISPVYDKLNDIKNARDNEPLDDGVNRKNPVCFVEAVHSVGEWRGVHRIKDIEELNACLWHYDHEPNWYLCKQLTHTSDHLPESNPTETETESETDFY